MTDWQIKPLDRAHATAAFTCGQPSLDAFLKSLASQYERQDIGRTFVAVRGEEDKQVFGYYTLTVSSITVECLPETLRKKLPRELPLPVGLLGRLAVDQTVQGQGLGSKLMRNALTRFLHGARDFAMLAIIVEPLNESARDFYMKFGFMPFADSTQRLYLTLATLRAGFSATPKD